VQRRPGGHYYQGRAGERSSPRAAIGRLRRVGLIPPGTGHDDDLLYANGIGFIDLVKRPTRTSRELSPVTLRVRRERRRRSLRRRVP
jgi:hypothetical protein